MAQATVARPITPAQQRSADALLERSSRWARGVRHTDGLAFVTFTSSHLGTHGQPVYYYTSALGCTCPGYRHRGQCCHAIAVLADLEHQAIEERAVPALTTYRALYPECVAGCGELVERQGQRCDDCAARADYQARLAAKRNAPRVAV